MLELNKSDIGDGLLYWYSDINFLHFAILLFVICSSVLVLVSLVTPEPARDRLAGLTFQTADEAPERGEAFDIPDAQEHIPGLESDAGWRRKDLAFSSILVLVVGVIWWYFRG